MRCSERTCPRDAIPGTKSCERCRDRRRAYKKKYRKARRPGLCSHSDCPNKPENGFKSCEACRARDRAWAEKNRPMLRARGHQYYIDLKKQAMESYGGCRCACCGEKHLEFLSIDHLENGGAAHRKSLPGNGKNFYYWLRDNGYPKGFQVLCMNCNFALGHNGFCPHHPEVRRPCMTGRPRKSFPTQARAK